MKMVVLANYKNSNELTNSRTWIFLQTTILLRLKCSTGLIINAVDRAGLTFGATLEVLGNTNVKAEGIYLSGSYDVEGGSQIYLQMTCKRGRINGVGEGHFSTLSVLWIMP
ncbi:uncharacterized protein LOC144866625 [Branchiostoma floridae x Branchiostoma japonicum]